MGKFVFDLVKGKNIFVVVDFFSSFLTFKQTKEQILFQAKPSKIISKTFVSPF